MRNAFLIVLLALSVSVFTVSCNGGDKDDKTRLENIDESFDDIIKSEIPVIVDFYADWCGPCKTQSPIIDELKEELGDQIRVVKVDIDNDDEIAEKYGIQSIPTIIIFQNGEIIWKAVGVQDKETLKRAVLGDKNEEVSKGSDLSNFDEIIQSTTPVIVDFYAVWCGPCKIQTPILEEIDAELGDKVQILKVDVDYEVELAQRFEIQSIPTLLIFKEGQLVWKAVGVQQKETLLTVLGEL